MRFASALLIVALGCNQRLGLTDVKVDEDRDGLIDAADNCPDDPNPDQEDWDLNGVGDMCEPCDAPSGLDDDSDGIDDACDGCVGPGRTGEFAPNGVDVGCQPCATATGDDFDKDGIDDACDPCARGDDHDEDADGVADGCDVCPTRADPAQEQTSDMDRLGDECDPDIDPLDDEPQFTGDDQSPRMFDPLGEEGTAWEDLGGWTFDGESAHMPPNSARTALYEVGLRHVIETRATLSSDSKSSITISLYWEMPPLCQGACLFSATECKLDVNGDLTLTPYDTQRPQVSAGGVDVSGPVRIWMRSRRAPFSMNTVHQMCVAIDKNGGITRVKSLSQVVYQGIGIAHEVTLSNGLHETTLDYLWLVNN